MRILLVEDDARIAGFMKRRLVAEAYEVDLASEKAQTFALIEACAYDIIMDIFLGSDDGLDICRCCPADFSRTSAKTLTFHVYLFAPLSSIPSDEASRRVPCDRSIQKRAY